MTWGKKNMTPAVNWIILSGWCVCVCIYISSVLCWSCLSTAKGLALSFMINISGPEGSAWCPSLQQECNKCRSWVKKCWYFSSVSATSFTPAVLLIRMRVLDPLHSTLHISYLHVQRVETHALREENKLISPYRSVLWWVASLVTLSFPV